MYNDTVTRHLELKCDPQKMMIQVTDSSNQVFKYSPVSEMS